LANIPRSQRTVARVAVGPVIFSEHNGVSHSSLGARRYGNLGNPTIRHTHRRTIVPPLSSPRRYFQTFVTFLHHLANIPRTQRAVARVAVGQVVISEHHGVSNRSLGSRRCGSLGSPTIRHTQGFTIVPPIGPLRSYLQALAFYLHHLTNIPRIQWAGDGVAAGQVALSQHHGVSHGRGSLGTRGCSGLDGPGPTTHHTHSRTIVPPLSPPRRYFQTFATHLDHLANIPRSQWAGARVAVGPVVISEHHGVSHSSLATRRCGGLLGHSTPIALRTQVKITGTAPVGPVPARDHGRARVAHVRTLRPGRPAEGDELMICRA